MRVSLARKHFSTGPSREVIRSPSRLAPGSVALAPTSFIFLPGAIVH